jgi:hypothetical protein
MAEIFVVVMLLPLLAVLYDLLFPRRMQPNEQLTVAVPERRSAYERLTVSVPKRRRA